MNNRLFTDKSLDAGIKYNVAIWARRVFTVILIALLTTLSCDDKPRREYGLITKQNYDNKNKGR